MNLTKKQLAQNADAMKAAIAGQPVQYKMHCNDEWLEAPQDSVTGLLWNCNQFEYRPKPHPVSRPWSKPEDVPLNCWIRVGQGEPERLVTMVASDGIRIAGVSCDSAFFRWQELAEGRELAFGCEYSTDRVTWKPCTVEDPQ
jgi:hypothetical protein